MAMGADYTHHMLMSPPIFESNRRTWLQIVVRGGAEEALAPRNLGFQKENGVHYLQPPQIWKSNARSGIVNNKFHDRDNCVPKSLQKNECSIFDFRLFSIYQLEQGLALEGRLILRPYG